MLNTLHKCNYPFLDIQSHFNLPLCNHACSFLCIDYIISRGKYYVNDSEMHLESLKCTLSLKPIHRRVIKSMYSIGFSQHKMLRGVIHINSCFCLIIIVSNVAHKPQRCDHSTQVSVSLYTSPETEWNILTEKQFMLTETYHSFM